MLSIKSVDLSPGLWSPLWNSVNMKDLELMGVIDRNIGTLRRIICETNQDCMAADCKQNDPYAWV